MNKLIAGIVGILLSMFLLTTLGGKELYTAEKLEVLKIDELMPHNDRIYKYIEKYAKIYNIPKVYIYRCAFLESNYKGLDHKKFAPFEDRLVSSANAYSVLQVRVIAARDVWHRYNYKFRGRRLTHKWSKLWFKEQLKQFKYRIKYRIPTNVKLEFKTDAEISNLLRYDLRFNVETGIRYMSKLYKEYGNYALVYSYYNQGYKGINFINSYARYITRVKV